MEELLIDRIVEEVINRIKSLNRKKVMVLIREDYNRSLDIIKSTIQVIEQMDIEVHLSFQCDREKIVSEDDYWEKFKILEFPKTESDMEVLLSNYKYESILISYIKLQEIIQINTLNISSEFASILFNPIYKNIEIYTDIYEFRGKCINRGLIGPVGAIISKLKEININMFPSMEKNNIYVKNENENENLKKLNIDKKIISMKDLYGHNGEIIVSSDAIITAMAEDYIRDENILVRRR